MDLRHDPIPALIIRIALPAGVGVVFSTLLNVTDIFSVPGLAIAWHGMRLMPADEPVMPGDALKVAP